jgi:hypothetical protein
MKLSHIRALFLIAALYDGALGLAFLVAPLALYNAMGIPPPNHLAYIQFPAAVLIVFAVGFLMVARAPRECRAIIPLGILLKGAYSSVVLGHWIFGTMPPHWAVFAWIDLGFLILFVIALRSRAMRSNG